MALTLAVTVHDPEERWLACFNPALKQVAALYSARVATCTGDTSRRTIAALETAGFAVVRAPAGSPVGDNRRRALRAALDAGRSGAVHYVDLDRLLHWQRRFPDELGALIAAPPSVDYTALGRTARAWRTHPRVQVLAERLTNGALIAALSLERTADFTAGSCICSPRAAGAILAYSTEAANGTDLEWPAIVFRELGEPPRCILTEGLEFETADYFAAEIGRAGSRAAWLRQMYDRPAVWRDRADIAHQSVAAVARVLAKTTSS